jgi:hypothetical protein
MVRVVGREVGERDEVKVTSALIGICLVRVDRYVSLPAAGLCNITQPKPCSRDSRFSALKPEC